MRLLASLCAGSLLGAGCGAHGVSAPATRPMQLQRVVLYQNGIGHFERAGHVTGETLRLDFASGELDDVLKTLTVIDRLGAGVATVDVPNLEARHRTLTLGVRMSAGRVHDLKVSYAVPTPTWKAAYRVVMDEPGQRDAASLLQGWAVINNASQEDWRNVHLTLATGAPMSFVHDLHTPEYVKRPDVHGHLVAPALGPIDNEKSGAGDADGDGILDVNDVCPDSREDRDAYEDDDGCPDGDNDRDRISDRDDKCPNEPETYNGYEDDDGCPDRGRVVVTDTSIEVLEQVYFGKASDVLRGSSSPIIDAIAATLSGNPSIGRIEIGGHASSDEPDAWALSSRRAAAVRQALLQRGIDGKRMTLVPYGATRPLDRGESAAAHDRNRRVDFLIAERREDMPVAERARPQPMQVDTATARRAVHTSSRPAEVAGSVRYELTEPVSIKKGTSSMVSILNKPISAHDVYLFRPDANAPGSDRHPFRAVRLVNDSGFMLEPGPIAIFARGSFVGDSMVTRLSVSETAWIPYALDGAATVTVQDDDREQPLRIVSIVRGVMTVENAAIHTTTYTIATGRDPAKQIFIRHDKADGFAARDLPPGTQDRGDSYLVPLPLQPGATSVLTIEERQPRRHTMQMLDAGSTQLSLYVSGSTLPPEIAERLATAMQLRGELGQLEEALEQTRTRLGDVSTHADDLRASLATLKGVRGAEDVRKKILASLAAATAEADTLAKKLGADSEALAMARNKLQDALRELSVDESKS